MRVLVIAAHQDDEVLGIGGAIRRHVVRGDEVTVLVACESGSLRYGSSSALKEATLNAKAVLGYQHLALGGYPDQGLDTVPFLELVWCIDKTAQEVVPDIVYVHHRDLNRDHALLNEASQVVFRPHRWKGLSFYSYYTPSATEIAPEHFRADTYLDITPHMEVKLKAVMEYPSEAVGARSVDAVRTVGAYYGSHIGVDYAEVFSTIRVTISG